MNEHANSSPSLQFPISSFHATQQSGNMAVQEAEGIAPLESMHEDQMGEVELQELHQNTTSVMDISEYPRATGEVGDLEAGSIPT